VVLIISVSLTLPDYQCRNSKSSIDSELAGASSAYSNYFDLKITWQLSKGEAMFIQFVCDVIIDEVDVFVKEEAPVLAPLTGFVNDGIMALCDEVTQGISGGSRT
jgi:hypothetical protein